MPRASGTLAGMGYLVAALVIVLAIVVAIAVAKLLISLLVIAVGVAAAIYLWYRMRSSLRGPAAPADPV